MTTVIPTPHIPFAFLGRVSTEDNQDPQASRNWQLSRATSLIEPAGGIVVAEFFDIGMSRSLPWQRRPRANALLAALADPHRGFNAVVIGEPQRAFYGNQYGLTMPVFTHYGVQLWVPEVGGPIDPDSEAHDLIMSVFGGMSKGERNRIKIRVRTAMASQAKIEGRYLGGRPPYGYRLADAGPHPNPAKAADGKRLHRLEPDPATAPVVKRIFAEYLAGRGIYAIAEGLTRDGIPSPSQADPARNRHRTGEGWAKSAVKAILANPRYTGRQVWNRQRKDEVLLDVANVADGYETKMRWNDQGSWVWSEKTAHEPLVSTGDFEAAQTIQAGNGRSRTHRERESVRRPTCSAADCTAESADAKCKPSTPAAPSTTAAATPANTPSPTTSSTPPTSTSARTRSCPILDTWLCKVFAPHRIDGHHPRDGRSPSSPGTHGTVRAQHGHRRRHRGMRRETRQVPGSTRSRSRPRNRRPMDHRRQSRTRRRPRQSHRRTHPQPARQTHDRRRHQTHRRRTRRHPRGPAERRPRGQSQGLQRPRTTTDLPARTANRPGRNESRPERCWGYGTCPRGDLNPHAR